VDFTAVLSALVAQAPALRNVGVTRIRVGDIEAELEHGVTEFALPEPVGAAPNVLFDSQKCAVCQAAPRRYGELCRKCARGVVANG
jgi:hypothetical protein